jgi:hypothetical protein
MGYKDIENRTWWLHMPPFLNYPETTKRIYIHTGLKLDKHCWEFIKDRVSDNLWKRIWTMDFIESLAHGAIIGEVDIVGCVEKSDSPWFTGPYGFVLANPKAYKVPIPCKGKLGFFEPDIDLLSEVKKFSGAN